MSAVRRSPGRPAGSDPGITRDAIVAAATELFARHGFDGVGMRDIARAAGFDVATVQHHAGSKGALYDAVFARLYELEVATLGAATERVRERVGGRPEQLLSGLHEILDAYLDFLDEHPELTALWLRRWLEPEAHAELDERYALPLYDQVEHVLAQAGEPYPRHAVRSIVWAVHGHITAAAAVGPAAAPDRDAFRAFMHRLVDGLYGAA